MEYDNHYWNDYTKFIETTESITGASPSYLLDRYKTLISELETNDYLEWIYEDMQSESTITKIHKIVNHDLLKDNILNIEFRNKVNELDNKMKSFLIKVHQNDENWWMDFNNVMINWKE